MDTWRPHENKRLDEHNDGPLGVIQAVRLRQMHIGRLGVIQFARLYTSLRSNSPGGKSPLRKIVRQLSSGIALPVQWQWLEVASGVDPSLSRSKPPPK